MRRLLPLLALLLAGACIPMVAHGPRVQPGWSGGARAGLDATTLGPVEAEDSPFFPLDAYFTLSHGWRSGAEAPGVLVGVQLPAVVVLAPGAAALSQGDVYVQLPAPPDALQRGAGVVASYHGVMPYVQLGREGPAGSGWHTTQGVAFVREIGTNDDFSREGAVLWMPGVAGATVGRYATLRGSVTAGLGTERDVRCGPDGCVPVREAAWSLHVGLSLEFHGARSAAETPRARAP